MKGLERLRYAIASFIKGGGKYEDAVNNFIRDLQKALITADVNVRVVIDLTKKIKEKALESEPPPGVLRREWFVKIVYDSLVELFGGESPEIYPTKLPWTIMLVGVQGTGKTTTAGKLANFYKKRGYRVGLVTTDTYRPAAYDQLKQISEQIGVPFYGEKGGKDPVKIAKRGIEFLKNKGVNVIIVDTAGRHGYGDEEYLLKEMEDLAKALKPDEVMLVIDAYLGQKAYDLAKKFHEKAPIGSITITKLDGTAKGGGAISAVSATGARIKFIGDGEKIDDIEPFNPRKFVSRVLGLGDLETLLEKFKALEESENLEKRWEKALLTGRLTLRDLYAQIKSLKKLGPLRKVLQMIPGLSLMPIDESKLQVSEDKMDKWLHIMDSMTYSELDNPHIIDRSRIRRIARGSGTSPEEVKELLNYYENTKRMLKTMKRKKSLLKRLGAGGVFS